MKINQITLTDLRCMNGKEGLILQGCGGEVQEWVDGINKMLTDKRILLDDTKFENASVFQNDGVTCILCPFEDVHLDIGKLAMWRLQSYTAFAGMWLSDYVDNRLGGFEAGQSDDIDEDYVEGQAMKLLIWQPIKFCVNNNPSSNNKTADCGVIRLSDLPRVNFSFLSAEYYARLSISIIA